MQARVDWVLRIFGTQVTKKKRPFRHMFPDYLSVSYDYEWTKSRGIQVTMIFKFLNFNAIFIQSKAHLLDGIIDTEYTFHIQISNSLSI